jgi:hypothetical protein
MRKLMIWTTCVLGILLAVQGFAYAQSTCRAHTHNGFSMWAIRDLEGNYIGCECLSADRCGRCTCASGVQCTVSWDHCNIVVTGGSPPGPGDPHSGGVSLDRTTLVPRTALMSADYSVAMTACAPLFIGS